MDYYYFLGNSVCKISLVDCFSSLMIPASALKLGDAESTKIRSLRFKGTGRRENHGRTYPSAGKKHFQRSLFELLLVAFSPMQMELLLYCNSKHHRQGHGHHSLAPADQARFAVHKRGTAIEKKNRISEKRKSIINNGSRRAKS